MTRLRADARLNHDKLLDAAAVAFAEPGADTSMTAIAKRAGVGVATLYRRFPTREALIEAVHRNETTRLSDSATALLDEHSPREALRLWMDRFLIYMATKEGMADALPAILRSRFGLKAHSRDLLRSAIAKLLDAGIADGTFRDDVQPDDVMMALGGFALIARYEQDHQLASRLSTLLMDGLSAR
jgi:AcrR family transcriptional regulator